MHARRWINQSPNQFRFKIITCEWIGNGRPYALNFAKSLGIAAASTITRHSATDVRQRLGKWRPMELDTTAFSVRYATQSCQKHTLRKAYTKADPP